MEPRKRELILTIIDGRPSLIPILYQFDKFVHADKIFEYFIKNGLIGEKFEDVLVHTFKNRWLSMGQWAIRKILKEKKTRPILAGRDFKVL